MQRLSTGGAVLGTYMFDAFGQRTGTDNSADPYLGYESRRGGYTDPETGLTLFTFRYYDTANGRFLNRDPIGYRGGVNVYGYCGNNPAVRVDPFGSSWWGDNPIGLWISAAVTCGLAAGITSIVYEGDNSTCDPEKHCNEIMSCIGAIAGAVIATITADMGPLGGCIGAAVGALVTSLGQAACHYFNCGAADAGDWGCDLLNGLVSAAYGCAASFLPDPAPGETGEASGTFINTYLQGPLSAALGSVVGNGCSAAAGA
ncbi:MAG TPA: RHS repeat-associated core domain-containing protein [Armatimonadota bacterium]|nr:RHS repeat-associated core domain-containing protein [Armatimonadota bacterium]